MADMTGWPTDGADGSVSSEARWRAMARLWAPSGVVVGYLGSLVPSLSAGTITVQAGAAWIDGHYAEIAGSSTFPSTVTGLVVARFTPADNKFELVYRDGATTPTQGTATWELPIARVTASALYDVRPLIPVGGSAQQQVGHVLLTAAAPNIDFPGIPSTYNHLRLVASLRGDTAAASVVSFVRFNGDTGATYDHQTNRGRAATSTAAFTAGDNGVRFAAPGATAWAASWNALTVDVPQYRGGSNRRTFLVNYGWNGGTTSAPASNDLTQEAVFGQWRNTNTITQVTVVPSAGNWAAGSMATLYGLT